jgi:hypothetical protein
LTAAVIVGPSPGFGFGFGFGFAFTFAFVPLPVFFLAPSMMPELSSTFLQGNNCRTQDPLLNNEYVRFA